MPERRFSVQIELKLYDFAVPEGYDFFPIPDSLRLHLLVVHYVYLLEHLVDLSPGGDSTIIQNLVENRQSEVSNSTQDLLKVSRNGSVPGFRVNRHDTKLLRHLRTHLPPGIEIVIERYHERSTQKMYMTMNRELNRKHIYMSVGVIND